MGLSIIRSIAFLAGLALVGHGLWAYSPVIAEIVVGAILVLLTLWGAIRSEPNAS